MSPDERPQRIEATHAVTAMHDALRDAPLLRPVWRPKPPEPVPAAPTPRKAPPPPRKAPPAPPKPATPPPRRAVIEPGGQVLSAAEARALGRLLATPAVRDLLEPRPTAPDPLRRHP